MGQAPGRSYYLQRQSWSRREASASGLLCALTSPRPEWGAARLAVRPDAVAAGAGLPSSVSDFCKCPSAEEGPLRSSPPPAAAIPAVVLGGRRCAAWSGRFLAAPQGEASAGGTRSVPRRRGRGQAGGLNGSPFQLHLHLAATGAVRHGHPAGQR